MGLGGIPKHRSAFARRSGSWDHQASIGRPFPTLKASPVGHAAHPCAPIPGPWPPVCGLIINPFLFGGELHFFIMKIE